MIGIMLTVEEWRPINMIFYRYGNAVGVAYFTKRSGQDEIVQARRGDVRVVHVLTGIFDQDPVTALARRAELVPHLRNRLYNALDCAGRDEWDARIKSEFET